MEKVSLIIETKYLVSCPHCNNSTNRVDHLFTDNKERMFGPWYCDNCGNAYGGKVIGKDVYLEKLEGKRIDKELVFLRYGNLLLGVLGNYFDGEHDSENSRYFYEEHTCPSNYFKDVELVINLEEGDMDPHGIFEYLGSIPFQEFESVEEIQKALPPGIL